MQYFLHEGQSGLGIHRVHIPFRQPLAKPHFLFKNVRRHEIDSDFSDFLWIFLGNEGR